MDLCTCDLEKHHYFKVVVNIIRAESGEYETIGGVPNALNRLKSEFGIQIRSPDVYRSVSDAAERARFWKTFVLQLHPAWFDVVESKRLLVISTWDVSRSQNVRCPEICGGCGSIDFPKFACFNCDQSYCNRECQTKDWPSHQHLCTAVPPSAVLAWNEHHLENDPCFRAMDALVAQITPKVFHYSRLAAPFSNWRSFVRKEHLHDESLYSELPKELSAIIQLSKRLVEFAQKPSLTLAERSEFLLSIEASWITILLTSALFSESRVAVSLDSARDFLESVMLSDAQCVFGANRPPFPDYNAVRYWPVGGDARFYVGLTFLLHKNGHRKASELLIRAFFATKYMGLARSIIGEFYSMQSQSVNSALDFISAEALLEAQPNPAFIPFWDVEFGVWLLRRCESVNCFPAIVALGKIFVSAKHRASLPFEPQQALIRLTHVAKVGPDQIETLLCCAVVSMLCGGPSEFNAAVDVCKSLIGKHEMLVVPVLCGLYRALVLEPAAKTQT